MREYIYEDFIIRKEMTNSGRVSFGIYDFDNRIYGFAENTDMAEIIIDRIIKNNK